MSLYYYNKEEEKLNTEESINNYKDLFNQYNNKLPKIEEALEQMFLSNGVTYQDSSKLIKDIKSRVKKKVEDNFIDIKNRYPNISEEDSKIISSYTYESSENEYSPYRLLNQNLVAKDRKKGIESVAKYFYLLLKTLRKLDKYFPIEEKFLYRGIRCQVKVDKDTFNPDFVPYIRGNYKVFWSFTSTSPKITKALDFLKENKKLDKKSGTIFSITGDVWGYDISLFNLYGENEVLLEPERKFYIDEVAPLDDIIYVKCIIQNSPLVLNDESKVDYSINNEIKLMLKHNIIMPKYECLIAIAEEGVGKNSFLNALTQKNIYHSTEPQLIHFNHKGNQYHVIDIPSLLIFSDNDVDIKKKFKDNINEILKLNLKIKKILFIKQYNNLRVSHYETEMLILLMEVFPNKYILDDLIIINTFSEKNSKFFQIFMKKNSQCFSNNLKYDIKQKLTRFNKEKEIVWPNYIKEYYVDSIFGTQTEFEALRNNILQ